MQRRGRVVIRDLDVPGRDLDVVVGEVADGAVEVLLTPALDLDATQVALGEGGGQVVGVLLGGVLPGAVVGAGREGSQQQRGRGDGNPDPECPHQRAASRYAWLVGSTGRKPSFW